MTGRIKCSDCGSESYLCETTKLICYSCRNRMQSDINHYFSKSGGLSTQNKKLRNEIKELKKQLAHCEKARKLWRDRFFEKTGRAQ